MRVEESIEIDRPVEEVFAYVANPQNLLEWSGLVIEVKDAPEPLSEGDTFTTVGKFLGRRFETPFERIYIEPNRRYTDEPKAVRSLIRIGPTRSKRYQRVLRGLRGPWRANRVGSSSRQIRSSSGPSSVK